MDIRYRFFDYFIQKCNPEVLHSFSLQLGGIQASVHSRLVAFGFAMGLNECRCHMRFDIIQGMTLHSPPTHICNCCCSPNTSSNSSMWLKPPSHLYMSSEAGGVGASFLPQWISEIKMGNDLAKNKKKKKRHHGGVKCYFPNKTFS